MKCSKTVRIAPLLLVYFLTAGCGHAPSFNLLGSYFPAWLVCLPVAISLTVLIRLGVRRLGVEDYFRPEFLSYLAAWAFFTFVLWLVFFS
jgi:hypothetical protein